MIGRIASISGRSASRVAMSMLGPVAGAGANVGLGAMNIAEGAATRAFSSVWGRAASRVGSFGRLNSAVVGVGTLGLGTVGAGIIGLDLYATQQSMTRAAESEQMSRMILTAQSGPFGPSGRMMGISSNNNNTAGLTLAAHYAKNRNKSFGVLGLKFL